MLSDISTTKNPNHHLFATIAALLLRCFASSQQSLSQLSFFMKLASMACSVADCSLQRSPPDAAACAFPTCHRSARHCPALCSLCPQPTTTRQSVVDCRVCDARFADAIRRQCACFRGLKLAVDLLDVRLPACVYVVARERRLWVAVDPVSELGQQRLGGSC